MRHLLTLLILTVADGAFAQAPPPWSDPFSLEKAGAYQVVRADKPIVLDGKLDDAAWTNAQRMERFVVPPKMDWVEFEKTNPRRARSLTRAWMIWDDRYLYFAAEMEDRDLYAVSGPEHDSPFASDDLFEVFIKPSDEEPSYWELHVAPSGGTRDYFYARRSAGAAPRWAGYDSGMQAAVSVSGTLNDWTDRDNEWIVEMRVPWSAFERWGGKPKVGDSWRMLISRYDYSVHLEDGVELSAAAPLPWGSFHLFEYYPYVVFK